MSVKKVARAVRDEWRAQADSTRGHEDDVDNHSRWTGATVREVAASATRNVRDRVRGDG